MRRPSWKESEPTEACLISFGASVVTMAAGSCDRATGGAELQVARLTRLLAAAGVKVALFAAERDGQAELEPLLRAQGIRLVTQPRRGIPHLRYLYALLPGFWRGLQRANAAVYYLRGSSGFLGVAAAFCRRFGRRLVFAVASDQDLDPEALRRRFSWRERLQYQYGLRRADAVVVQTRLQQEALARLWGRDGILIRSLHFAPSPPQQDARQEYVLWAGRARQVKRPDRLLELAQRLPELRFAMAGQRRMAGEAGLFTAIEAQAQTLPNVLFLGAVPFDEMPHWYDRSWVLINTSDMEGFPNTFLEAWGRGIPVVATVDPDHLLRDRGLGYACADVEEMAERLQFLRRRPEVCAEIGARARAYVQSEHRQTTIVEQYRALFSALASERGPTSPREGERGLQPGERR